MKIFKSKWFVRFTRQQGIEDHDLCDAIANAEKGLIDADLGGAIVEVRCHE